MHRNNFKKVSHIIFDLDGVLLDTETLYTQAIQNVVGRYGKQFDWSIKAEMMGMIYNEGSKYIVDKLNLPITPEEYYELAVVEYQKVMTDIQLMPGAANLVQHLHKHNIPLAVATSSSFDSFKTKSRDHDDFFSLFNHIVCGGSDPEVKQGKPKPDVFLVCASRFKDKPLPENCLVFEDSPSGVKAGISAGMQVVMLPDKNLPLELQNEAHLKVSVLDQVPLEKFGLPPLS